MTQVTPSHLTYDSFDPQSDLCQGDILEPTETLQGIFKDVHPHFLDKKYNAFLVLTQTCDLVKRDGKECRSRYVNLAVVRPIEDVLCTFLDKTCDNIRIAGAQVNGIYFIETKPKAQQLLQRIFNQNEQSLGLFYLHPDHAVKIFVDSVALLQVSIALRSQEHYTTMVEARCGRLSSDFRAKLGWLIGNLFSRVASRDLPQNTINELTSRFLDSTEDVANLPLWVSKQNVTLATKAGVRIEGIERRSIIDLLEDHKPRPSKQVAIDKTMGIITEVLGDLPPDKLKAIRTRIDNDPEFTSSCKRP
jgi:hypothetical protein